MCADKRICAAVDLLLKAPMLTVAQAMRAVNYTDEESKNRTMQMQVRRALERKKGGMANNVNPFLTPRVGGDTPVAAVSSLTSASSGGVEVLFPQPKLKRIRRAASAMQQELESQAASNYTTLMAVELDILIRYHGAVPKGGKQEKTAKWKATCDKGKKPAVCLPWTKPEEAALCKLQTEEITIGDTHLGRQEEMMKRELLITRANLTDTEWSAFCEQRQRKIDDRNQPPTAGGIG